MPTATSPTYVRLRTLLILALTIGLLWYFFRNVQLADVWTHMRGADPIPIAGAVGATFLTYVFRTWRWQLLLLPLGRAAFAPAFRATVIGFTAIFLLPGRVGEVLRAYLLARETTFNFPSTFATIIIERLLDLVAVLLLFGCFLLLTPTGSDAFATVKYLGALAGLAAAAGLAFVFVCAGHPERLGRWAQALGRWLPGRLSQALSAIVRAFAEGLAVMRRPSALIGAMALSVPLWLTIAAGIWLTSRAFDLTMPFAGSFLVATFLVVGVALPTPGGIGGFEAMYQEAVTRFFGASDEAAVAAALVLHALSTIPIAALGVIFMARAGLTFGRLKRMQEAGEPANLT